MKSADSPAPVMIVVPCFGYGGLEQVVLHLARGLDRGRFTPSVCSLLPPEPPLLEELLSTGVPCHVLDKGAGVNPVLPLRLARLMRREGIRLVNSHDVGATIYAAPAARLAGVRHVVHTDHSQILALKKRLWLFRGLLRGWTSFSVTVSHELERHLVERLGVAPRAVATVPNAVDTERFAAGGDAAGLRRELGLPPDAVVVGSIGRLTEQKGYAHLLRAFASLAASRPLLRLVITGTGELRGDLEREARAAGIAGRVIFTGVRRDVPTLLALFDVFVLPSLWEGQPITLMEAMAAGRPIVATDVGDNARILGAAGTRDGVAPPPGGYLAGERGLLVPSGDAAALAAAVGRLADDRGLASSLGARAAAHARGEFDVAAMVRRYEAVYESVLAGSARRSGRGSGGGPPGEET